MCEKLTNLWMSSIFLICNRNYLFSSRRFEINLTYPSFCFIDWVNSEVNWSIIGFGGVDGSEDYLESHGGFISLDGGSKSTVGMCSLGLVSWENVGMFVWLKSFSNSEKRLANAYRDEFGSVFSNSATSFEWLVCTSYWTAVWVLGWSIC